MSSEIDLNFYLKSAVFLEQFGLSSGLKVFINNEPLRLESF